MQHSTESPFSFRRSRLYADRILLSDLAARYGTPLYVYSQTALLNAFDSFQTAFDDIPHLVSFALKCNSNGAILNLLARRGAGADIVSGGELARALRAGFPPDRIVFAGVGKTDSEIAEAIKRGILMLNAESEPEVIGIQQIAAKLGRTATLALRVNPDIDPRTHPYISTGLKRHKFGIPFAQARKIFRKAAELPNLRVRGLHIHLGSQVSGVDPFRQSLARALELIDELAKGGIRIDMLDLGGGFGIRYRHETPLHPKTLARAIGPALRKRGLTLILEPGRAIAGAAGLLLTQVLYRKRAGRREFVVVDAGMNDLIRPSLYGAYHEILPCKVVSRARKIHADIVGPVCETADFLARGRTIQDCHAGDLLAVMNAGAYGFAMSSNYNSRPRAAEVLVNGKRARLIRRRETVEDIIRTET